MSIRHDTQSLVGTRPAADRALQRYAFDNDNPHASTQHTCLAAAYDPLTIAALQQSVRPGMRCLEVGAGGGSIARWLAARVAPAGSVLATDIKPHHISPAPGLTTTTHDISTDPLPAAAYDLIHARLVLLHLPDRLAILHRLVQALAPGGHLHLEEFDETTYGPLIALGELRDTDAAASYARYISAKQHLLETAGVDLTWGRTAATAMNDAGLTNITATPHVQSWRHDSPGTALQVHNTHHLRDQFLSAGLTTGDLDRARQIMNHPDFLAASCLTYAIHGQKDNAQ
jgi:SAM-dependent methyltransferase